jgi:KaiC/GvpD/RAD55 family RecA-like ATPase
MRYVRVTKTKKSKGFLIPETEVTKRVYKNLGHSKDAWFQSLYYYDTDAIKYFEENRSIKGYNGKVTTNVVVFDLDSEDLGISHKNVITLIERLKHLGLYKELACNIYFSGGKGFHVYLNTEYTFTPKELKAFVINLTDSVPFIHEAGFTLDPQVYNTNRIFRLPNTKHEKSGLYKIQVVEKDLVNLDIDNIAEYAKEPQATYPFEEAIPAQDVLAQLNPLLEAIRREEEAIQRAIEAHKHSPVVSIDKHDKKCIRIIEEGNIPAGKSNSLLLRLCSFYQQAGLDRLQATEKLLEVGERRAAKYPHANPITAEKVSYELIRPVYDNGGYTFNCRDSLLQQLCAGSCNATKPRRVTEPRFKPKIREIPVRTGSFKDSKPAQVPEVVPAKMEFQSFKDTANNFDKFLDLVKNSRVLTGIREIDEKVQIIANGITLINAKSGVGKTTILLNMLESTSEANLKTMFFCADMDEDEFFTKAASKHLKITPDAVYDLGMDTNPQGQVLYRKGKELVSDKLENVMPFYNKELTIEFIKGKVKQAVESDLKVAAIFIDYIQCIRGCSDYGKGEEVLTQLKSLVSQYKIPIIALSQIPRNSGGDESAPIYTAAAAQGGSVYEQKASIVINLWRPFKFIQEHFYDKKDNVLGYFVAKNRMGECFGGNLHFNGAHSEIRSMTSAENEEFEIAREALNEKLKASKKGKFR